MNQEILDALSRLGEACIRYVEQANYDSRAKAARSAFQRGIVLAKTGDLEGLKAVRIISRMESLTPQVFGGLMCRAGLTPYHDKGWSSYQDKPLNQGGIRIEVAGEVASVWSPKYKINELACTLEVAAGLVDTILPV